MKRSCKDILESINSIKTAEWYDVAWNDFNKFHNKLADNFTDKSSCSVGCSLSFH